VVEIQLEKLYGLAEYTALKLSKLTDEQVMERIALKINTANKLETFEGILGETSGLFYAMLLDASGMIWRKEVNATCDLGELTRKDYLLARSQNLDADAEKASQNYGIKQLKATEAQRAKEAETKKTAFSKLLIDGNVCTIPLENAKLSFDPRSSIPFGVIGTVYPNIIVDDNWGRLIVKNGALVNNAITRLCVSAKDLSVASQNIETEYFILELKDGWRFVPGKRNGDYELIK
jgi:hypothetical protein